MLVANHYLLFLLGHGDGQLVLINRHRRHLIRNLTVVLRNSSLIHLFLGKVADFSDKLVYYGLGPILTLVLGIATNRILLVVVCSQASLLVGGGRLFKLIWLLVH